MRIPVASKAALTHRAGAPLCVKALTLAFDRALALAAAVDEAAQRRGIDPLLLHAMAHVESHHRPQAISRAGARGLLQLMPATATRHGVTTPAALHDPRTNLSAAADHLKTLQARYGNNLPLVLAAYNAGPGAVDRHGRQVPPYPETQRYVRAVMATYQSLRAFAPGVSP
jgi:soluble lytic murein transglycosylase-like protein